MRRHSRTAATPAVLALMLRLAGVNEDYLSDRAWGEWQLAAQTRAEQWNHYLTREPVRGRVYAKPELRMIYSHV